MSNYKNMYKEKMEKMLFLEINQKGFKKIINMPESVKLKNSDLYIPINASYVTENANNQLKLKNLPIYYFVEGMFTALGADPNLRFCVDYGTLLTYIPDSEECIKSIIAEKIKNNNLSDAYILLKGYYNYAEEKEIMEKLLNTGEAIREKDSGFTDIFLEDIEICKENFKDIPEAYLYSALIYRDSEEFEKAQIEIHEYINKGGEKTPEVELLMTNIDNVSKYEKAVELVHDNPEKALRMFDELKEQFDKNPLIYYYMGVCLRKLEMYNKAIHYLNKSIEIESGILEVVNELGMNYACLGEYDRAIECFTKAFEASRDINICTNLIMSYYSSGNINKAKETLEIAKKIDEKDEIVIEIDKMLNREADKK